MRKLSMDELMRPKVDEFAAQKKVPVIIVLDNIRSGLNIGSVFRTADAFAMSEIILTGVSACPPHKEIYKTALGSTESVQWKYFETNTEAIEYLHSIGFAIIAVEQTTNSLKLHEFDFEQLNSNIALVFGNEVSGVSDDFLSKADLAIEIPQLGTKHSINVAVCAGIVSWEFMKHHIKDETS
jgi:23S rRNA (guanosine2251-2'-O)-methyltransferase